MKKIYALLITTILLMSACQPTPEGVIVKTKAGEALEESIQKTNNKSTETAIPNAEGKEIVEQYEVKESNINHSAVNERGNISLNIDASVYQPSTSNIPVAVVAPYKFTQSELNEIVMGLVGEAKFLDVNIMTKARLDELIIGIKKDQNDLNSDLAQSNGIETVSELNAYAKQEIERLQSLYENAIDNESASFSNYIDVTTNSAAFNVYLDSNNITPDIISYSNNDSCSLSYSNLGASINQIDFTDLSGRPHGEMYDSEKHYDIDISYEDAKKIALDAISKMNISNMIIGDTFITYNPAYSYNRDDMIPKYYVFCFQRIINNVIVDYAYTSAMISDDTDASYSKPMANEYLRMWVSSDGVVQFIWSNPLLVSEILNESVEVSVGIEEAISAMQLQAFIQYADMYGNLADDMVVNIDKITLSLARIRYKGHPGQYIVVPVWDFYGDVIITSDERLPISVNLRKTEKDNEYTINNPYQSIITVNALDGSIIARSLGY